MSHGNPEKEAASIGVHSRRVARPTNLDPVLKETGTAQRLPVGEMPTLGPVSPSSFRETGFRSLEA
jgi:hypothetical protein